MWCRRWKASGGGRGRRWRCSTALGCIIHRHIPGLEKDSITDETGEAQGLTFKIYDNLDFSGEPGFETVTDRSNLDWWGPGVPGADQTRFCARLSGTFTAREAGNHIFALASIGKSQLLLDGKVVIDNWDHYDAEVEKTGEKTLSAGQKVTLKVEYLWEGTEDWRFLRVGHWRQGENDPIAEAVEAAAEADAVVIVAGLTNEWESESYDRINMELPGKQNELIERVAQANPNTIVVLNVGSPVSMPWQQNVRAIVQQWYNSQECGNALADILFGDVNPSGKLATTFPVRYEDNPAFANYPGENGKMHYREGLFVGYRHYDAHGVVPLFPFGHGLSYTSFEFSNLQVSRRELSETESVDVSLDVRNAGERTGKEVVQVYVHDAESTLARPEQELKAFTKVELQAGESKRVQLHLESEAFRYYDPSKGGWIVEPGRFEIRVGNSSRNLPLRAEVSVRGRGT